MKYRKSTCISEFKKLKQITQSNHTNTNHPLSSSLNYLVLGQTFFLKLHQCYFFKFAFALVNLFTSFRLLNGARGCSVRHPCHVTLLHELYPLVLREGDAVEMLQLLQPLWELSSFKLLLIISVL